MDLNLSLNEIVEQEVLQRTKELEQQLETQQKEISTLKQFVKAGETKISKLELSDKFLTKLKENKKDLTGLNFHKLHSKKEKNDYIIERRIK